jgi:phage-related tail fiber protein
LSAYLGGKFNKGDEGVGNFRLPETRGEFLRGWDHGRGADPARAIGSYQQGTLTTFDSNYAGGGASVDILRCSPAQAQADVYRSTDYPGVGITYTAANISAGEFPSEGGVTRPRNITVMWCIKAWSAPVNQGNIDVAALVKEVSRLGSAVPVGAVMAFPTGIVPPGFLELDGSVQSIATYPDLATYLGTIYNKGDEGTGNFRLPDSRGEFLRGWDHGRGVDAGRNVGTAQADMLKAHNHSVSSTGNEMVQGNTSGLAVTNWRASQGVTGSTGGTETRPRNVAVMWCIKAWNAPINQGSIDVAALAKEVSQLKSSVPVGAVLSFPMGVVPAGYLELDGSVQSIATYPDLAAYLGTTFNKGDEGVGNFRLPESRGEFLRGWDHGRGVDAGRGLGTNQGHSMVDHCHTVLTADAGTVPNPVGGNLVGSFTNLAPIPKPAGAGVLGATLTSNIHMPSAEKGGIETRPRNLAVMWCIKAWNAPINQGSIDVAALSADVKLARLNGAEVGAARNLRVSLPAAASVATLTADQLIVEQPGVGQYKLSNVNLSINLATVGAGGMDFGVAPANGSVGIYVIYNPELKVAKLLGVNATSTSVPEIYNGTNLPVGYSASALVSVWQTDANRLMNAGIQHQRSISIVQTMVLENGLSMSSTPISLASVVPKNAKSVDGYIHYIGSTDFPGGGSLGLSPDVTEVGLKACGIGGIVGLGVLSPFSDLVMTTPQTIYYRLYASVSRANDVHISQYTF